MADFPKDEYGGYRAPWADVSGIYHVVVGEDITRIGEGNFNVWGLETVSLPSTLKVIGARAFSGCRMLGSVDLPAALERIETGAFSGCASMKEARLLGGVKVIGPEAFQDCISLASIDMPVSLDSIGSKAFAYCALTEVSVPEGLACVGDSVFYRCPLGHAVYSNTHFISFTPMASPPAIRSQVGLHRAPLAGMLLPTCHVPLRKRCEDRQPALLADKT